MTDSNTSPATGLSGIRPATEWRQACASGVFSTRASWDWFRRTHAEELTQRGVLIPGRGRRGDLVTGDIDDVIVEILRREAGEVRA